MDKFDLLNYETPQLATNKRAEQPGEAIEGSLRTDQPPRSPVPNHCHAPLVWPAYDTVHQVIGFTLFRSGHQIPFRRGLQPNRLS